METVPNREKPSLLGKGTLLVSCPRNHTVRVETMLGREAETWSDGPEVVPPSNVNIRAQSSLIREGPLLPPLVWRCLVGSEVIQRQRTGRVASVGAARLERGRGRDCCKAVASSFPCSDGTGHERNDERADGENPISTMRITARR
jgi:hypothetical protein